MMLFDYQNAIVLSVVLAGLVGWVDASVRQLQNPGTYSSEETENIRGFTKGFSPDSDLKSAKLRLWPSGTRCNKDIPSHEISLAPETCLSGSYSIENNIRITDHPVCSDGSTPVMVFYGTTRCTGNPLFSTNHKDVDFPEGCFWSTSPKHWSMIFRCGIWPTLQEGADEYATAVPPNVVEGESDSFDDSQAGLIETHGSSSCVWESGDVTVEARLQVDTCLETHAESVRILKPAYCANGTRAILTHFEGDDCNHSLNPGATELAKTQRNEAGSCQELNPTTGWRTRKGSMMFWCGDQPVENPKPRAASVSHSACLPRKAPLFKHPKTDTCLNLESRLLKIYNAGVCANGTRAVWAKYDESNCIGKPGEVEIVTGDTLSTCLDVGQWQSISFWCTGQVVDSTTPPSVKSPFTTIPSEGKGLGRSVGFVVGLSLLGLIVLVAAGFVAFAFRDQLLAVFRREGRIAL
ncbi:hypothetical protein BGZ60DRAFT_401328 [Tricladium varicosporioides]|nr:hypothetical protein BGZ60DRAFT_401328 [Hymenoscyphus varicosporioides]